MTQRIAVFDIDGVLADNRPRQHLVTRRRKDWDAFFAALAFGWVPIYASGRPERCRSDTSQWLERWGFPAAELLLRADDDRRPALQVKREFLTMLGARGEIVSVVDDDEDVIDGLTAVGFPARLVDWLPAEPARPAQEALFED
jgi:FMN phosphatase YigB (HAD superfamily)